MNPLTPAQLVEQVAQIPQMERGKLSVMRHGSDGAYYKLQAWENGKNHSRYVARDQVPAVKAALAGYQQFQELTAHYAQHVITKTRAELAARSKKKTPPSPRPSSSLKTRRSDS